MLVVSGEPVTTLVDDRRLVEQGQPLLQLAPAALGAAEDAEAEGEALFSAADPGQPQGLHARPAALLAQAAKGFAANICLHRRTDSANAKSLVSIMALQTVQGDALQVSAVGADAEQAIQALVALLASGCGEQVAALPKAVSPAVSDAAPGPSCVGSVLHRARPSARYCRWCRSVCRSLNRQTTRSRSAKSWRGPCARPPVPCNSCGRCPG